MALTKLLGLHVKVDQVAKDKKVAKDEKHIDTRKKYLWNFFVGEKRTN